MANNQQTGGHSRGEASSSDQDLNSGRGWHGDPDGHAAAGRKGGQKISRNREHMSEIGKKGGEAVSRNREHMAEIGRRGGQAKTESSGGQKARSTKSE